MERRPKTYLRRNTHNCTVHMHEFTVCSSSPCCTNKTVKVVTTTQKHSIISQRD